jgi:hypothetical protein
VNKRSPPPTSLKQHEDVLQEEWYKIPLQLVEVHSKKDCGYTEEKGVVQHHINNEKCTVFVVFPLFCSTTDIFVKLPLGIKEHSYHPNFKQINEY